MRKPSERTPRLLIGVGVALVTIAALLITTEAASITVAEYPQFPKTVVEQPRIAPERVVEVQNDAPQAVLSAVNTLKGTGNCEYEVSKYDWDIRVARAVMLAESGGDSGAHNFSHQTKDDSWGCFQINLYGNLAKSRPAPEQLVVAEFNVAYAYQMYLSAMNRNGWNGRWNDWSAYKNGTYLEHLNS